MRAYTDVLEVDLSTEKAGTVARKTHGRRASPLRLTNGTPDVRRPAGCSDADNQVNLAQTALNAGNLNRTVELLDEMRPGEGEEDLRGWEWNYLWRKTHSEERKIQLPLPDGHVGSWAISRSMVRTPSADTRNALVKRSIVRAVKRIVISSELIACWARL